MTVSIFNPITQLNANPPMKTRVVFMDRPIKVMAKELFDAKSYKCWLFITEHESHFNALARNKSSGATGIGQLLPQTMRSLGLRNTTNPNIQLLGQIAYLSRHFGSVCGGARYWKTHFNY